MNKGQIEFGRGLLSDVAEMWGVDTDTAAKILLSREQKRFFEWLGAYDFLDNELWKDGE